MATLRLVPTSGTPIEISKDPTVVGRDPGCDLVLSDGSVSRRHARFEKRGFEWAVVDQGSANGTFIDSQRVAEVVLRQGQELRFGALSFRVEVAGTDDMAATVAGVAAPESTVVSPTPLTPAPTPPRAAPPPPLPRPAAARPSSPPPPSAAAARERFHSPGGPSASSPVPQMRAGPAPAKKGRGPFFWIATGCCGCLLLVLAFAALLGGGLFFMTKGAADAVHGFVADVKAGNLDKAHDGLSESYKARMSQAQLERLVDRHPGLKDNTDASFWKRSVENDTATLTGVLTPTSGKPEPVTFKLVKEAGAWKISEIQFEGEGDTSAETPSKATPPDDSGAMQVETTQLNKEPAGSGTKVTIKTRARGFALRKEGRAYRIDLLGDLETLGPGGRIDSLSKDGFYTLRETTATAEGAYADFKTDLTFTQAPPGDYTVRVTLRDQVGGSRKTHLVTFSLP